MTNAIIRAEPNLALTKPEKVNLVARFDSIGELELGKIQKQLNDNDFLEFIDMLTIIFGKDYYDKTTQEHQKAKYVFTECLNKNYSKNEFFGIAKAFFNNTKYTNWLPSEFFNISRPKFYSYYKLLKDNANLDEYKPALLGKRTVWINFEQPILYPLKEFGYDNRNYKDIVKQGKVTRVYIKTKVE